MSFATKILSKALLTQANYEFVGYLSYTQASHWFNIRHLTGISKKLKLSMDCNSIITLPAQYFSYTYSCYWTRPI